MDRNRLIVPITSNSPVGSLALRVTAEAARLTSRDRRLLGLLDAHRTLTTEQVASIAFGTVGRARVRLSTLRDRGVLDRFRHYQRPGSQSWRWTLGPVGAAIVAGSRGEPFPRPSAVADATARLAVSPTLGHLIGVNGFFTRLHGHARHRGDAHLDRWWNEARCRTATGGIVRPDGHGLWTADRRQVAFWLEYDTGTEPLSRVVAKLGDYGRLGGTRWALPVLFYVPGPRREANLAAAMSRAALPAGLTVATASDEHADATDGGPAGPIWRTLTSGARVPLSRLPATALPADEDSEPWDG